LNNLNKNINKKELMDEEKIRNLISQSDEAYENSSDMGEFKKWTNNFSGEEYVITSSIYEFICIKNKRPSTFIWYLPAFKEEIFKHVSSVNILPQ